MNIKLKESIPTNGVKIIELYNKINSELLETRPIFQRKLVWKKQHKFHFIETILMNFPFPEVYIASAEIDVELLTSKEIVVDGQQRLNTIVDYIKGINDFENQKRLTSFENLSNDAKKDFLNYLVSVKDLKDMKMEVIKEIFSRINSTDYALNSNERLNASLGDGEFAMFCKQIVDPDFNPTNEDTDIIVDKESKEILNIFFKEHNVFTENDKNRMFNIQFIMILVSTILEGRYFSRSSIISSYLEKYNSSFLFSDEVKDKILKAVRIIENLKLSINSYWFNKANLLILLVELSKINENQLNFQLLESQLLDLEKKFDIYFADEDIGMITEDERKYFEYSRQGSNGLNEREHRGKVVRGLIESSLNRNEAKEADLESKNIIFFKEKRIDFATIKPTETGLKKNIMDAISNVRDFLNRNHFHDYENQEFGPDKKVNKKGIFIEGENEFKDTNISLYRANGRGDYRIWFTGLDTFAKANDVLALINKEEEIMILNLTRIDYTTFFEK